MLSKYLPVQKKFRYFFYFLDYLGYRLFVAFFLSIMVGMLDGIGLALFIPLLSLVLQGETSTDPGDQVSLLVIDYLGIPPDLVTILGLIFFFFILKGIAKYLEGYVRVRYQQYFIRRIRIRNIDLLDLYDYQRFVRSDVGRIQNSFTGEVERISNAFRFYFKAFQYGVLVAVYVVLAFVSDAVFSFIVAIGGIGINFIFKVLYRKTKFFSRKITGQNHLFQGMMIQRVSLFTYLKTTGLNRLYSNRLKSSVFSLEHLQLRLGHIDAVLGALREPLTILVVVLAIYLQVVFLEDKASLVILSLLLLYRALTFFMGMQEQWNFFLGLSGSLDEMEEFSKELSGAKESEGKQKYQGFSDKLELKNIDFHYQDKIILRKINLEIHKNETIALIGESGAGKTTLMHLISGLVRPSRGIYLSDGYPVASFKKSDFRQRIGYIPQDPAIFNDTVFNNVSLWSTKDTWSLRRFHDVIKRASLGKFLDELPEQEDTLLGNNGINLSGGQKQRICIARELFKQVDILLLDEATSALDSKTEKLVQHNIDNLKGQLTIVVIAHRLATIKNTDRAVLLKEGRIHAVGPFEELVKTSPEVMEMTALQNL